MEAEKKICRASLKTAFCIALAVVSLTYLLTDQLIEIFNSEGSDSLAAYASEGIRLYFPGFLIAAFNIIMSGFYSAVGRGTESSAIALSRGIFSVTVMAFLLSRFFGVTGVWLAFPASELITLGIALAAGKRKTAEKKAKSN